MGGMIHRILIGLAIAAALPVAVCAKDKPKTDGAAALRDPDRLVSIGQRAEARGQAPAALSFYEQALAIDPRHVAASRAAAELALRHDLQNSVEIARRWTTLAPKDAAAQLLLADACLRRGLLTEAGDALTVAAANGAPASEIGARKGLALDLAGDSKAAQLEYARALSGTANPRALTLRLALSLALTEDYPAALQLLQGYANVPGDNSDVRRTLAKVYAVSGQPEAAADIMRAAGSDDVAQAMAPYYARLAGLPLKARADALHFDRLSAEALQQAPGLPASARPAVATAPPVAVAPRAAPVPPAVASAALPLAVPPAPVTDADGKAAYWVQIASVPDAALLPDEWRRLQRRAAGALAGRAPHVQQNGKAHRLIIGPFETPRAAQALVNKLKAQRVETLVSRISDAAIQPMATR